MAEIDMAAIMRKIREDKQKPQGGYIAKGFDEPVGDYETAVRLYRELKARPQAGKQIILVPSGGGMEYTEEAAAPRNAPSVLPAKRGELPRGDESEETPEEAYRRLRLMKLKEMGAVDE